MQNLSGKRTGFGQDSEELRQRSTEEAIPLENGGGDLACDGLGKARTTGRSPGESFRFMTERAEVSGRSAFLSRF